MNKLKGTLFSALVTGLCLAAAAQTRDTGQKDRLVDLTLMYSNLHTNAPVGTCNCFWMNGGAAELSVPVWRNLSAVGEVGGHTTTTIPYARYTGLSLLWGMGGLRLRVPTHRLYQPFGQVMVGGVHGFNSYFPQKPPLLPTSADTSFSMALGGGVDWALTHTIWIRLPQLDYHYSQLHNLQGDRQNQFRMSAGVVIRFPPWLWEKQ